MLAIANLFLIVLLGSLFFDFQWCNLTSFYYGLLIGAFTFISLLILAFNKYNSLFLLIALLCCLVFNATVAFSVNVVHRLSIDSS